jgi:hypothetical protein
MVNRYYYHWLLDTDNDPATGRSNSEYEGNPTGVVNPIGAERVIMIGWRNGQREGIEVYDALDDDVILLENFAAQASGNTLTATIPLADLGLVVGQTVAISAFQEGESDGWSVDWIESAVLTLEPPSAGRMKIDGEFADWDEANAAGVVSGVEDPADMLDPSGDIRSIQATVEDGYLYLRMSTEGDALPAVTPAPLVNRYYYHWLLDTDNDPATGRSNSEYEGNPTGLANPIGSEVVVQIGWNNNAADGVYAYDALTEDDLISDFEYSAVGNSVEARIRLSDLGLVLGQTIAISAFQEGQSDDWSVDWIESTVMTLSEGGPGNWTLPEPLFSGNPYGFELLITDEGELVVDPESVNVRLDGQPVPAAVSKDADQTLVTGKHAALLTAGSTHKLSVSLQAGDGTQSKDLVFVVAPYTVLPPESRFLTIDTANKGFLVGVTMISSGGQFTPEGGVHSNIVALAENQLAGEMLNEAQEQYYNEVEPPQFEWVIVPVVADGPVNWYEHALERDASLNFPNDEPFAKMSAGVDHEGMVIEIRGYLELAEGYHKIGLYTEGGHKISAGLDAQAPVLSVYDNTDVAGRVPSYFARNQFVDVVATDAAYYPIRFLWFQTESSQEDGMMLEIFSVKDRQLHLLNDAEDSKSIHIYRAGILLDPDFVMPTLTMQVEGNELVIEWTGTLQATDDLNGSWDDYTNQQSPLRLPAGTEGSLFFRARSNN